MSSMKRWIHILISILLTGILLVTIFSEVSPAEFIDIIAKSSFSLILLYFAVSLFSQVIRAIRYRLIFKSVEDVEVPPLSRFLVVTFIRSAFVDFLPARLGELSFLYVLNRYGIGYLRGATAFAVCMVLDVAVLLGIFLVFTLFSFLFGDSLIAEIVSPDALLVVTGMLVLISLAIYKLEFVLGLAKKIIPIRFKKIQDLLSQVVIDTHKLKSERVFFPLLFLTFLLRLAKYSALYILLCAVIYQWHIHYSQISPVLSFVAFVAAEASASLPVSGLMGFGAYELVWGFIFSLSNVKVPSVEVLIFAIHIITQVLGYGLGFLALLVFFFDEFKRKRSES